MEGPVLIEPTTFHDKRGFFFESFNRQQFQTIIGRQVDFLQDNVSYSRSQWTLHGLHFQKEPFVQAKLVSVIRGAALDVVVDLRRSSPDFGQHFSIRLSAEEGNQLFVPRGFAHGFMTLEPNTIFTYKVSNYYSPKHDCGIRFDDQTLGIDWGADPKLFVLSNRDTQLPSFDPNKEYFA